MKKGVVQEISRNCSSGYMALVILLVLLVFIVWMFVRAIQQESIMLILTVVLPSGLLFVLGLAGLFMVHPNQARVLTLFGKYVGSARETGLRWANPFYAKQTVSLRVRNFDCDPLKVNDSSGNPIEIAAVVVWEVVD